ncbi:MAG: histidinol-phosphatase HisJ family protein [Verrucomicrobium sp.]|nr:histidinol-phosphatase HisJ family protein [Verrucomicrobium sp.]
MSTSLFDYHTHTPLCRHAEGAPIEYVRAAQAKGLSEIGFSDHNPMPTQFDDWRMAPDELPKYLALVEEARAAAPGYPVRLGLECDFIPGYEDHIRRLAAEAEWDYLIGSVHYLAPGWDVDGPKHVKKFTERPVAEIWELYFAAYAKMAQSGLFDFFAHPDLVKKFGYRPEGDLSRFYGEALEAVADSGKAIEVSTAGLRKEVKEIYPSKQFLEMAFRKKIPVLINSDAHAPGDVGHAFDQALALVKEVGYTEVVRFAGRKAIPTPL